MARYIAFCNEKGGVAKSTTAEAFAAELVARGKKVLTVDLDAQPGNLSLHVGGDKTLLGAYELLTQKHPSLEVSSSCIQRTESFGDLIAADADLNTADERLASRVGRESVLKRALGAIGGHYDFILLDTPPAMSVRTINALVAADDVIIPTTADLSAVAGAASVLDALEDIRDVMPGTAEAFIAIVNWDARVPRLARELEGVIEVMGEERGAHVLPTRVRRAVAAQVAQRNRESLITLNPSSTVARDYKALVDDYLDSI